MDTVLKIMPMARLPKLKIIYLCIWDLTIIECFAVVVLFVCFSEENLSYSSPDNGSS